MVRGEDGEARVAADGLSAFAGGFGRDGAGVDDAEVGVCRRGLDEAAGAEERGELLALVVVDPATEGRDGERLHSNVFMRDFAFGG